MNQADVLGFVSACQNAVTELQGLLSSAYTVFSFLYAQQSGASFTTPTDSYNSSTINYTTNQNEPTK
eukprot:1157088-Pelagomonas_calceolata.AAC.2